MNFPQKIIVHHSAVSRDKNSNQYEAIRKYHLSKGWGDFTSYHYIIEADGKRVNGRKESQAGAHTSQKLMNYRSIGICLTGNFDAEEPTKEQCAELQKLIAEIRTRYPKIQDSDIVPHRNYAPKSCWGSKLPDDIIGYLDTRLKKKKPTIHSWAKESVDWCIARGIATNWDNPDEIMANADAELMLFRAGMISENTGKGLTKQRLAVILKSASM